MSKLIALLETFKPDNICVSVWSAASIGYPMNIRFITKEFELDAAEYLATDLVPAADDKAGASITTMLDWSHDKDGNAILDMSKLDTVDLNFFTETSTEEVASQFDGKQINTMMDAIVDSLRQPKYEAIIKDKIFEAIEVWENEEPPF